MNGVERRVNFPVVVPGSDGAHMVTIPIPHPADDTVDHAVQVTAGAVNEAMQAAYREGRAAAARLHNRKPWWQRVRRVSA